MLQFFRGRSQQNHLGVKALEPFFDLKQLDLDRLGLGFGFLACAILLDQCLVQAVLAFMDLGDAAAGVGLGTLRVGQLCAGRFQRILQGLANLLALRQQALRGVDSFLADADLSLGGYQRLCQVGQPRLQRLFLQSERSQLALGLFQARLKLSQPLLGDGHLLPCDLGFAVQFAASAVQSAQFFAELGLRFAQRFDLAADVGQGLLAGLDMLLEVFFLCATAVEPPEGGVPAVAVPDTQQIAQILGDLFSFSSPVGLALEVFEPRTQFGHNILDAGQILLGCIEPAQCGPSLDLVAGDARCLFEE